MISGLVAAFLVATQEYARGRAAPRRNYGSLTSRPQPSFNTENNCVMMKTFGSQRFQWELRIIGGGETNNICIKMHMGKRQHQLANNNNIPGLFSASFVFFLADCYVQDGFC